MKRVWLHILGFAAIMPAIFSMQADMIPVHFVTQIVDCPVFEAGLFPADQLRTKLLEAHCIVIRDAEIIGPLAIPLGVISIDVENVVFNNIVDFYEEDDVRSNIKLVNFFNCQFREDVNFHSLRVQRLWLNGSEFQGHAVFQSLDVGYLNLADVKFEKSVDFSGATIGRINTVRLRTLEPIQISWSQFGENWWAEQKRYASVEIPDNPMYRIQLAESQLRFWNQNFQQLGYQSDAQETNHLLIEFRKQHLMKPYSFEWFGIVLTGLLNRHGTKPFRPIWIGIAIIILFALVYWRKDPFTFKEEQPDMPKTPLWIFSLLYSVDTFIPFTEITGVTKWGWQILPEYRWITLTERLLGFVVTVLATYSIASYAL